MLSAPPIFAQPMSGVVAIESSPIVRLQLESAIRTPDSSPQFCVKEPSKTAEDYFKCFEQLCHPIFEKMLTRIASHADILENAQRLASWQLVETLCQPFFDEISQILHEEISGLEDDAEELYVRNRGECEANSVHSRGNVLKSLRRWDEQSTDAEEGSAFATLLSSDGEGCDFEWRTERDISLGWISHTLSATDAESTCNREKDSVVCRHWETKGWCRFDRQCKFLHPAHTSIVTVNNSVGDLDVPSKSRTVARRNRARRNKAKYNQGTSSEVLSFELLQPGSCRPYPLAKHSER